MLNKIRLVGLLLGCLISISCNNAFRETFEKKQYTEPSNSEIVNVKRKQQLIDLAIAGDYILSDEEVSNNLISFLITKDGTSNRSIINNKYNISKIDSTTLFLSSSNLLANRSPLIDDYDEVDFYLYEVSNKESNESGFAVLTNDRRVGEIICFVDNSDFNQDISDFPFMQMFCSNLEEYIEETAELWNSITNNELQEFRSVYADIASSGNYTFSNWVYNSGNISSITKTDWNQRSPYNSGIEAVKGQNYLTGCGATSVAQIIAFHEFPKQTTTIIKEILNKNWDKTKFWDGKYNWELMKEYSRANYLSTEGKSMVGALMYQVAEGIQSSYGTSATSSYSKNYSKFLESIGYSTGVEQPYSFETIKKSIDNKCPLIITGASKKITKINKFLWWSWETTTGYEGGHAFIIDGYCNMKCTATNRTNKSDVQTFTTNYVHCNLGWGGSCDGYYIDNVLATGTGSIASDSTVESIKRSIYGEDYYYKYCLKIIPNIKPKN